VALGVLSATDSLVLPAQSITTVYGRDYHPGTPNTPPRFINSPDSLVVQQGSSASWTARAEDDDNDPVSFSFTTTASYVQQLNDSTIRIAPVAGDSSRVVRVIASDGRGGLDTFELRVIVEPAVGLSQRRLFAAEDIRLPGSMALYDLQGRVLRDPGCTTELRLGGRRNVGGCHVLAMPAKRPVLVAPRAGAGVGQ
jgi:hypothetical protein